MEVLVSSSIFYMHKRSYDCRPMKVILVQAENEFSAGTTRSPYMQQIIDLYRANGIVIRSYARYRIILKFF